MPTITCQILDSISHIKKEDWDAVFGDIPEGYQFYKTLEESKLKEFIFYYLTASCEGRILLIAPLFITDFNLDIAAEGWLAKLVHALRKAWPRFLIMKTLFCGSPFGEQGVVGVRKDAQDKDGLLRQLVCAMNTFCREKNIPLIIFKDFLQQDTVFLDSLLAQRFLKMKSFPSVVTALPFNSFEAYLKSLGHATRKSLRKKLKKAPLGDTVTVKVVERADSLAEELHMLYECAYHSGSTKFEKLTKEFFIAAGQNMSPHAKFFLYYCEGRLAAFNLCFAYRGLFIDKFIGFDYELSRKYNLYFVSWRVNVEWCIQNALPLLQSGQTDYYPKLRLGGRLIPLYAYLKHRNAALHFILSLLAAVLKPENFDQDISTANDI